MAVAKPLVFIAAAAVAVGLVVYVYHPATDMPLQPAGTTTLRIGSNTIVAEVADTDAARELGLSNRTELAEGKGMWFVFATDDHWPFWMKDTFISLDIVWVAQDGTIVTIADNVQPSSYPDVFWPGKPARYVLELPGGYAARHGIAEGDMVEFRQEKTPL